MWPAHKQYTLELRGALQTTCESVLFSRNSSRGGLKLTKQRPALLLTEGLCQAHDRKYKTKAVNHTPTAAAVPIT